MGAAVGTETCQWAKIHVKGHRGMLMCRKACSEFEGVCGHKSVPVGMKVCQWAQRRVSGHKGVLVGTKVCQWGGF